MAALTQLDTHVVLWLHEPRLDLLSEPAAEAIEEGELTVSPMTLLELRYLYELGRTTVDGSTVLEHLEELIGLRVDDTSFRRVVSVAAEQTWTRDPFDRLIAAQALASGAKLVTADKTIRANLSIAVW